MLSGWISYVVTAFIGLSLLGTFGDSTRYLNLYGVVLILLFVWWVLRRVGIIPAV